MLPCELDDAVLRPKAVFDSSAARDETRMAPVAWREQNNIGISGEGGIAERFKGNERVVLGGQDKCWQRYSVHYANCARAVVVAYRIAISGMGSGESVIELPEGMHTIESVRSVSLRVEKGLVAKLRFQTPDESPLVEEIGRTVDGIGRACKIEGRGDPAETDDLWRSLAAPFARQLQDDVSSHGRA